MFFGKQGLKPSTVAQVMADFQDRIAQLEHVVAEQQAEASRQAQAIEDARAAMEAANKEVDMAKALIANLKKAYEPTNVITVDELRAGCKGA